MKHLMALAAIAAAALTIGACADQDGGAGRLSTEPSGNDATGDAQLRYVMTASAELRDPRTRKMVAASASQAAPGVSASVAAGGTGSTLQIANGSPGIAASGGYYIASFADQSRHQHTMVLLYPKFGGPPTAMQHYVDGALESTTGYSWQRTAAGWVRASSLMRVVRNNVLVGTYTTSTTTAPTKPGKPGGPAVPVRLEHQPGASAFQRMMVNVAYHAALVFAPQDASAQSLAFLACTQEWLRFTAAAAAVTGIIFVIADAPALSILLTSQYAAAVSLMGAAEDALLRCILANQPPSVFHFFGGGAGGGGGAGSDAGNEDCLEGSYAAHCTTPFTL
jgi:hypothetical protein